ncbi:hypothetical protein ACEPAG_1573 [Sanghuangporus baumii]
MYIYNDYLSYAILDLVDNILSTIHTHVVKKRWLDAWHVLDALAKFNVEFGDWINIDDGERARITEWAHGALIVATIRALDAAGQSNQQSIPDIAYILRDMTSWTDVAWRMLGTCYHRVLKAHDKKLFKDQPEEDNDREEAAIEKAFKVFLQNLTPEERQKGKYRLDIQGSDEEDEEEQVEDEGTTWYDDGDIMDIDMKDPSFRVFSTWKKYKDHLRETCRVPFYGPPVWDLTQWTDEERQPFKFH